MESSLESFNSVAGPCILAITSILFFLAKLSSCLILEMFGLKSLSQSISGTK